MEDRVPRYLALTAAVLATAACGTHKQQRPNVLVILADDLGMGDVSCYGSETICTPNIDSLAAKGVRFTNAYATSSTSTPSRYALMTGMYPWTNPAAKILPGDAPLIIPTDARTLPKTLREAGYATGAIGKWHLGMGAGNVDWNTQIEPSANSVGFDYTCLVAATNDRVPTVFVRDGRVVGLDPDDPIEVSYEHPFPGEPTALEHPEMLRMKWHHGHHDAIVNGIPRIGFMKGGKAARWVDEQVADFFVGEVKDFIDRNAGTPFFLYYGLHQPHVPRTPAARFVGSTTMGPRGDAVVEADWCVGDVLRYLDGKGLLDNTIVVFTSDNGPVVNDGYEDGSDTLLGGHDPRGGLRGGKYSLFDAGTHIPMLVYWKGHTSACVSDAFISHLDMYETICGLCGIKTGGGLDSRNLPEVFLGKSLKGRPSMVLESQGKLAYKKGTYVLIPPYSGPETNITGNELGNLPDWAMFDLSSDRRQQRDISREQPDIFSELKSEFLAAAGSFYDPEKEVDPLK